VVITVLQAGSLQYILANAGVEYMVLVGFNTRLVHRNAGETLTPLVARKNRKP
jgi:hypothetical protein